MAEKNESLEQVESRLEKKKAALKFIYDRKKKGMGRLSAREESALRRARRANLKETRSGSRVKPMTDFTSKKKDPYANPNE